MVVKRAAVVFVHGIFSSGSAWKPFIDLIALDAGLTDFELLPFEYASPVARFSPLRRVPEIDVVADSLRTFLDVEAGGFENLIIVSHSQGGLVVQRYLAWMVNHGRGGDLERIRRVIMFACPNSGSEFFISVRRSWFGWRNPQEQGLRPINAAVSDAQRTILERVVHAKEVSKDQCPIPLVAYVGESDGVVDPTSAKGLFMHYGAIPGDHSSIIRPSSLTHRSYTTLKAEFSAARADFPTGDPTPGAAASVTGPTFGAAHALVGSPMREVIAVGSGAGDLAGIFVDGYSAGGGAAALGTAVGEATWISPGYVQEFEGSSTGERVYICVLPSRQGAVVPRALWLALGKVGGGTEHDAGIALAGFPVPAPGDRPAGPVEVIDAQTTSVDLLGGAWIPGRMVRRSINEPWIWQPVPRLGFSMFHNSRWTGDDVDLRVRAVVDVAYVEEGPRPEITRALREKLRSQLAVSEFANVIPVLTMHRGASIATPDWKPATGPNSYGSGDSIHLRATVPSSTDGRAMSGEVILNLPADATALSMWVCVELQINFADWRTALTTAGADQADDSDLRLSLQEIIHVLSAAWSTAASIAMGFTEILGELSPARPPYAEMHLRGKPIVITPTSRQLGLFDAIDFAPFGQSTRESQHQETGMRVEAPLDINGEQRRELIARGLAKLGQHWGYIDADFEDLLVDRYPKSR